MNERIEAILSEVEPAILTYTGSNMLEDGVIDSFTLVEIISALEDEFNIEFDADDIIAENFANKDVIIDFVKGMLD